MTGLLLVLMFVLTIFMVVQFVLSETISGQESELDALSAEVAALAQALGLEQDRSSSLQERVGALTTTLGEARTVQDEQSALISVLQGERAAQDEALSAAAVRIASFEAQVASLLAGRDTNLGQISDLEGQREILLSEQEQLQLALAGLRSEVDAQVEAARLAAARREALEALVADLEQKNADVLVQQADLSSQLSDEEAARLAEAAAAEVLREKLQNAETELTAMTLALEEQRRRAEETLTLLAAAQEVGKDLDIQLAAALLAQGDRQVEVAALQAQLNDALARLTELQTVADSQQTILNAELTTLEERLADAEQAADAKDAELGTLMARLATMQAELAATRVRLATLEATTEAQTLTAQEVRAALTAALAAKLAAEQDAARQMTAAEERAALLAQARAELARQTSGTEATRREQALLNQQVAALRSQLGQLQALLDDSKLREAAANVQLQSLGSDLNAALARVAAEERRRRELEEEKNTLLAAEKKDLEKFRSEFFGRLRDILGAQEGVRIVGDRFVFSSEVLFAPGEAHLSAEGEAEIAKVAGILRNVVDEIPPEIDWVLRVDGHTDAVPISTAEFSDNWELSQARALSVVRYMINTLGIPPTRLSANGFGEFQPLNPADTPEARAQNRRIEMKFTEK